MSLSGFEDYCPCKWSSTICWDILQRLADCFPGLFFLSVFSALENSYLELKLPPCSLHLLIFGLPLSATQKESNPSSTWQSSKYLKTLSCHPLIFTSWDWASPVLSTIHHLIWLTEPSWSCLVLSKVCLFIIWEVPTTKCNYLYVYRLRMR